MKKNYVKPSLLSETFVAENVMTNLNAAEDADSVYSAAIDLYMNGTKFSGITFSEGNTLQTVSVNDFNL